MNARRGHGPIHGLYAVTPDIADTQTLVARVSAAIEGGALFVQYRNKDATRDLKAAQARALKSLCCETGSSLIVNDDVELALAVDAEGVHLGADDGSIKDARKTLGRKRLIGVSCYDRLELARTAQAQGADYVAFGSFFPSRVKRDAVRAPLDLLVRAHRELHVPVVAIGGITAVNAVQLVATGADALAVISALFDATDIASEARRFTVLFESRSSA